MNRPTLGSCCHAVSERPTHISSSSGKRERLSGNVLHDSKPFSTNDCRPTKTRKAKRSFHSLRWWGRPHPRRPLFPLMKLPAHRHDSLFAQQPMLSQVTFVMQCCALHGIRVT